jgi:hypothetical protein
MGQSYGYGSVSEQGFVAFEKSLEEGAWQAVETKRLLGADKLLAKGLDGLGVLAMGKLRVRGAIDALAQALAGQSSAGVLDTAWDRLQTRLDAELALKATDEDEGVVAAAKRARAVLLAGEGTAQTQFTHKDEVTFGRTQVRLAKTQPLAADVALLGVASTIARIGDATEALAKALGGDGDRALARSLQVRGAWTNCVAAFNGVHDDLAWLLANTAPGAEREKVSALLAPFERLLDDHKERGAPVAKEKAPSDEPVTKPTG